MTGGSLRRNLAASHTLIYRGALSAGFARGMAQMNTMFFRTRFVAAALATSMVIPSFAWATPERAAEYYQQASAAYQRGDLQEAADLLERAYAEDPDLVYQYNRVLALEGLKKFDESLRVLNIYADPMRQDSRQRFTDVDVIKTRLQENVALKKKADEEAELQRQKDEQNKVKEPKKIEDPVVVAPASSTPWLAIGLIAGGGVALGAGALFGSGLLVGNELDDTQCVKDNLDLGLLGDDVFQNCPYEDQSTFLAKKNSYDDDVAAIETQQTLAIVFLSAGAVMAVGGIVVWALDDGGSESTPPLSAQITPWIGGGGAGATLDVSF